LEGKPTTTEVQALTLTVKLLQREIAISPGKNSVTNICICLTLMLELVPMYHGYAWDQYFDHCRQVTALNRTRATGTSNSDHNRELLP